MNTCCSDHNTVSAFAAAAQPRTGLLIRLAETTAYGLKWLKHAYVVSQQRHDLAKMSDDRLDDIGLDRVAARQEAARPFWDFTMR